jgi:hypothetical protein
MGHSLASLYKFTSIGDPLTKGSFGSCSSRGVKSVCEPYFDVVRAARVFARVRKRGEADVPDAIGDVEGNDWAGVMELCDTSELRDWERDVIGTVR